MADPLSTSHPFGDAPDCMTFDIVTILNNMGLRDASAVKNVMASSH